MTSLDAIVDKKLRALFDCHLEEVLAELPQSVHALLAEVPLHVEDYPSQLVIKELGLTEDSNLCGVYSGVPLDQRTIDDRVENNYLDFAETLLEDYNPKAALAGVLKVAFESEFSSDHYTEIRAIKGFPREGNRRDRRDRQGREGREGRRGRRDGHSFVDGKGQSRLFIAKGKVDNMTPPKLVEYIEKQSRVKGRFIQGVEIYKSFSFVNVSFNDAETIIRAFKSQGQRSIVERAKA